MAEHTVWVVFTPGQFHHWRECVFACPVAMVEAFIPQFGTIRAAEDRVTFYRYRDVSAARIDAFERWTNARQVVCDHYCNEPMRCPTCNRRFYAWAQSHTRGRAPNRAESFYEAAAKFREIDHRSLRS